MKIVIPSYIAGPVFLVILFALCLGLAVLIKKTEQYVKCLQKKQVAPPPPPKKRAPVRPARAKTIKPKPHTSIEIDPDEIDRIYVRKTG